MPPFGFGDDQISIFAEIPDLVLPSKQSSYSFALPPPPLPPFLTTLHLSIPPKY